MAILSAVETAFEYPLMIGSEVYTKRDDDRQGEEGRTKGREQPHGRSDCSTRDGRETMSSRVSALVPWSMSGMYRYRHNDRGSDKKSQWRSTKRFRARIRKWLLSLYSPARRCHDFRGRLFARTVLYGFCCVPATVEALVARR